MPTHPIVPAEVRVCMDQIRAKVAELHIMHDCDQGCPPDCQEGDHSELAYRYHDEHNADVREEIAYLAEGLVSSLEGWLSPNPNDSESEA